MYETSVAILFCAEYNFEKLKAHWGDPESPEQFLRWRLEGGIAKCVKHLLFAEKYHWNIQNAKTLPVKLRKKLVRLMNNSASIQMETERIMILKKGIENTIAYIQKIKNDKKYLNSKSLQNIHEYLKSLLDLKISQ